MQYWPNTGAFVNVNNGAAVLFEARSNCAVRTMVNSGPAFGFEEGDKWLVPAGCILYVAGACVTGAVA